MLGPNFRLVHFHEAEKCLRLVGKLDIRDQEFWANLLGAVVNTNIACIPDSVASALVQESMAHEAAKEHVRKKVKEAKG